MNEKELKQIEQKYFGDTNLSLEDYRNFFNQGLDLIKTGLHPKKLLLKILDDYLKRLDSIPATDLSIENIENLDPATKEKAHELILFGTQAALIKEKSDAYSELERETRNYQNLLSVVTHEFKNSLTSIYGYNRIIKKRAEEGDIENMVKYNAHIDRLARNLFGLVETLLGLAQIEQNELVIRKKLFDIVNDAINPVIDELDLKLKQASMSVKVITRVDHNSYYGDERFFQLIFRNLIQNATQYGYPDTAIEIEIKKKNSEIIITVLNQGSGVEKKNLDYMFKKFSRFHDAKAKVNVGIGLYAVKNIITLHGGQIEADSEPSKWMKFTIHLPIEK